MGSYHWEVPTTFITPTSCSICITNQTRLSLLETSVISFSSFIYDPLLRLDRNEYVHTEIVIEFQFSFETQNRNVETIPPKNLRVRADNNWQIP